MVKLLTTGRTDLLPKFISKKGRPFSAYLVVGEGGKVGFEFAPREPKGKAKAKPASPAAPEEAPAPPASPEVKKPKSD
jgi:DNA topoisomerase-3